MRPDRFEEFERLMRPRARAILGRYRMPHEDGHDALQETLLSCFQSWESLRDPTAFFLVTLRNRCIVFWRRTRRREAHESAIDWALLESLAKPQEPQQEKEQRLRDAQNLSEGLSGLARRLVQETLAGKNAKEAAAAAACQEATVRKTLGRAIVKLREAVIAPKAPRARPYRKLKRRGSIRKGQAARNASLRATLAKLSAEERRRRVMPMVEASHRISPERRKRRAQAGAHGLHANPEAARARRDKATATLRARQWTPEERERQRRYGKKSAAAMTAEALRERGLRAAAARWAKHRAKLAEQPPQP